MNTIEHGVAPQDQLLVSHLHSLGAASPSRSLVPDILAGVGLADRYFPLATAAGDVFVVYNQVGVSWIQRVVDSPDFEVEFRFHTGRYAVSVSRPPRRLVSGIESLLAGRRGGAVTYDLRSRTLFQRSVLLKALEIPFGQIRPYGWVAREIGHPLAQRAVGSALATNPIPLLIPCHRVVRNDGIIGNYGLGGPSVKRSLLAAEGLDPKWLETLAHRGTRYLGSDTTHVFCFPSCSHARRVSDRHRQEFHTVDEALVSGGRPCTVCRPI